MPASSNVVEFTITFGFTERGSCGKTCRRACWLNLEAHPAQDESDVRLRICSRDIDVTSLHDFRFSNSDLRLEENRRPSPRKSKIQSGLAKRIGIEPTSSRQTRRQRF